MSSKSQRKPPSEPLRLEGAVESMTEVGDGVEVSVKLSNPGDRALHYIADVRAITFDPATRRLRVRLSQRGLEMPPGMIPMEPRFRSIDPHSQASLTVRLPKTIMKLASGPSPTGNTLFEEYAVADAEQIELEIGWSDIPYYQDPRNKSRGSSPVSSWEKQALSITYDPRPKRNGQIGSR